MRKHQFDELAKALAGGISRREALRRVGGGLAGLFVASVGLGKAWANGNEHEHENEEEDEICEEFCERVEEACENQLHREFELEDENCLRVCRGCRNSTTRVICCTSGGPVCCAAGQRCQGGQCVAACVQQGGVCDSTHLCCANLKCAGGTCLPFCPTSGNLAHTGQCVCVNTSPGSSQFLVCNANETCHHNGAQPLCCTAAGVCRSS